MAWIKKVARKAEKKVFGSGGAKRRYGIGKGKGGFKLDNVLKDIKTIKGMLNVEKKLIDRDVVTGDVGQVAQNTDGSMNLDVTPIISQGVGESNRVGNSLKVTGLSFPMSFTQQPNCFSDRLVRVSLYKITSADDGVTPDETYDQLYDINPLTGIRDFNSQRAYRNAKTDGIKLIRTQTYKVAGPQNITSGNAGEVDAYERQVRNVRFSVKLQDLLRYNSNAQTLPSGTRYILIIQCNAGNISVNGSTRDVAVTTASSGVTARIAQRVWYVDN